MYHSFKNFSSFYLRRAYSAYVFLYSANVFLYSSYVSMDSSYVSMYCLYGVLGVCMKSTLPKFSIRSKIKSTAEPGRDEEADLCDTLEERPDLVSIFMFYYNSRISISYQLNK